jgi:hypothetical protein
LQLIHSAHRGIGVRFDVAIDIALDGAKLSILFDFTGLDDVIFISIMLSPRLVDQPLECCYRYWPLLL